MKAIKSGILSGDNITSLKLIENVKEDSVRSTSCDLHIGDDVFRCGNKDEKYFNLKEKHIIRIEPFESVLISTCEKINLSEHPDIVGHFDLRIKYCLMGLILQVGPQVEPGYYGPLFGLLLNTQGNVISISHEDAMLTIEFCWVDQANGISHFENEKIENLQDFLNKKELTNGLSSSISIFDLINTNLQDCQERHRIYDEKKGIRKKEKVDKKMLWLTIVSIIVAIVFGLKDLWEPIMQPIFTELINRFSACLMVFQ
jgi:deoxycytidine triphosphate deaminase